MKFIYTFFLIISVQLQLQSQIKEFSIWEKKSFIESYSNENELFRCLDSLTQMGFFTLKIDSISEQKNFKQYFIHKGKCYTQFTIALDSLSENVIKKKQIQTANIDSLLQKINLYYAEKGFAFNQVQFKKEKNEYKIAVALGKIRTINTIILEGFKKIPKGLQSGLNSQFLHEIYTDFKLAEISKYIKSQAYLQEIKRPQVLFTKDSTKIYLYLQKNKSNSFDGIVGFGNDKNNVFKLTGNINLELGNIFNSLEKISFNWFSTEDSSQNLRLGVDIPYFLKSKIGSQTKINIYRQDSIFIKFNLDQNLYYRVSKYQKMGINGMVESSNYIDTLSTSGLDYRKLGFGLNYHYTQTSPVKILGEDEIFFLQTSYFNSYKKTAQTESQYFINIMAQKILHYKEKHHFILKTEGLTLLSDSLVSNELVRLGGVYSLRGFNENSIQASSFLKGTLEYKYIPREEFYMNVFTDFAWVENKILQENQNLIGLGFGIGFLSKFGLFTLQYAMGKNPNSGFNFNDSKIHIGIRSTF